MPELLDIAEAAFSAWHEATSDGKALQLGLGLQVETEPRPKRRRVTRSRPIPADKADETRVDLSSVDRAEHPEPRVGRVQAALRQPTLPVPHLTNPRCYLAIRECVDLPEGCFVIRSANRDRNEHTYEAFEPWAGRGEKFAGYGDLAWGQVMGHRAIRLIKQACPEAAAGRATEDRIVAKFDATRMEPT